MRGVPVPGQRQVARAIEANPLFILTELRSLYFYRDPTAVFRGTSFYNSIDSVRQSTISKDFNLDDIARPKGYMPKSELPLLVKSPKMDWS